jgi:hypothetical protein
LALNPHLSEPKAFGGSIDNLSSTSKQVNKFKMNFLSEHCSQISHSTARKQALEQLEADSA